MSKYSKPPHPLVGPLLRRLALRLAERGVTTRALELESGVSKSGINWIMNGTSVDARVSTLVSLARVAGLRLVLVDYLRSVLCDLTDAEIRVLLSHAPADLRDKIIDRITTIDLCPGTEDENDVKP